MARMLIDMGYPSHCRRAKPPNYNWTAFCNLFPALPSEKKSKGWMAIAQPTVWRRDEGWLQIQLFRRHNLCAIGAGNPVSCPHGRGRFGVSRYCVNPLFRIVILVQMNEDSASSPDITRLTAHARAGGIIPSTRSNLGNRWRLVSRIQPRHTPVQACTQFA